MLNLDLRWLKQVLPATDPPPPPAWGDPHSPPPSPEAFPGALFLPVPQWLPSAAAAAAVVVVAVLAAAPPPSRPPWTRRAGVQPARAKGH